MLFIFHPKNMALQSSCLCLHCSGLVEAAQSQLQTEFQSFLARRFRTPYLSHQDGSCYLEDVVIESGQKIPMPIIFAEVWWMDYHKDMAMPCNLHGSPTLRTLQFHYEFFFCVVVMSWSARISALQQVIMQSLAELEP